VLIVAAGALIFRDPLVPLQLAGIATSLAGVLLIVARAELETLMGLKFNWADIVIVVNMGIFAVYSACLRRQPPMHWMSFIFILAVISVLGTAPLHVWEHATGFRFQPTVLTLTAVAYVAVFPSVVAFLAWMRGIALIGASRAGAFLHLVPLYSALLAWLLLDERLRDYHVLGFILIIGGVWLAARRQPASVGEPAVPVRGGPARNSD
jgi:drug/metabolite transporter (DMT)-like permease